VFGQDQKWAVNVPEQDKKNWLLTCPKKIRDKFLMSEHVLA